jgi:hypothetical protein
MSQGTQGYSLTKKTEGRKSRDTVPLNYEYVKYFRSQMLLYIHYSVEMIQLHFSKLFKNAKRLIK